MLTVLVLVVMARPALASWTATGTGTAQSNATLLATPASASANVFDQEATVTWGSSGLVGTSEAATSFSVERVWRGAEPGPQGQLDGDSEPAVGGCAGTIAALTCTTTHLSGHTWGYRVIPHYATWSGPAGAESAPLRMAEVPTVTSLTLVNTGILGQIDAGDRIEIVFSERLDATSVCSGFSASSSGAQTATGITFVISNAQPNVISIDPTTSGTCGSSGFGSLTAGGTGNNRYTNNGLTATNSTLTWDPSSRSITVTLGTLATGTARTGVPSAESTYSPGALTADGLQIATGFTAADQRF
jgi:hypothetical protein